MTLPLNSGMCFGYLTPGFCSHEGIPKRRFVAGAQILLLWLRRHGISTLGSVRGRVSPGNVVIVLMLVLSHLKIVVLRNINNNTINSNEE